VIQPPTIGPMVGASTASTPANVVATPCQANGNRRNTAEKTLGINAPPEKPCKTRHAIRTGKLSLAAHPTEASVKTEMDATKTSTSSRAA
jgi:hypothetical protein